jgi:hypothetical protein
MAVTERCATTSRQTVAPHANRGKSWVLAMLAPRRGLRVAPVPPKAADLTRPTCGCRDDGRSGRRNGRFDRTKEQPGASWPCRHDRPSLTVAHPMVGETDQASHTEIRTLPSRNVSGSAILFVGGIKPVISVGVACPPRKFATEPVIIVTPFNHDVHHRGF